MAETWSAIPDTKAARSLSHNAWLPEAPSTEQFRALALVAMDAAKQAGADFADIRIGVQRECGGSYARMTLGYGIRARVNGTWSFEHGTVLTQDAISTLARTAVVGAKTASTINAQLGQSSQEPFLTVPVVTGEWHVPVEIDPLAVPVDDFFRMQGVFAEPAKAFGHVQISSALRWLVEARVFASTEGSLVTQSFTRGGPYIGVRAWLPDNPLDGVGFNVLPPDNPSLGFEVMLRTDYTDRIVTKAEEAIRWRELPLKQFDDVGRYPVAFDGSAFAAIVAQTVNLALDGDRLSGNEADASGRSFLQPFSTHPAQLAPEFSELLTITSHRTLPSSTAVQWDDDGIVPTPFTLVEKGTVVDFHTTRETAPRFENWYRQHSHPYTLHGSCVAPTPASLPMCSGGDVHVTPGSKDSVASVLELAQGIDHGFLILGAYVQQAPGLTTGFINSPLIVEVRNSKPVARLFNLRMAFITNTVLKSGLTALGDASTVEMAMASSPKGMPWQDMRHPMSAPAAHCKEVDILRTDLSR
jgi:TldD protein